jgi:hypothetical protein
MGEAKNIYRFLVGNLLFGKWPLGRLRKRWEDNIKMNVKEIGSVEWRWMKLAEQA